MAVSDEMCEMQGQPPQHNDENAEDVTSEHNARSWTSYGVLQATCLHACCLLLAGTSVSPHRSQTTSLGMPGGPLGPCKSSAEAVGFIPSGDKER